MCEIYNDAVDKNINLHQSNLSKSSLLDFAKVLNLEKINVNVISERAQEEHNKTTTKYNQNLMNKKI